MKAKIIIAIGVVGVLILTHSAVYKVGQANKERDMTVSAYQEAIDKFNKNSDRIIEAGQHVREVTVYKDRYFHTKEKEIEKVSEPMGSCPIPDDAVRVWNEAADCATGDSQALCGSGG